MESVTTDSRITARDLNKLFFRGRFKPPLLLFIYLSDIHPEHPEIGQIDPNQSRSILFREKKAK